MNILARKLSTHLLFSSPSVGRRLLYLSPITVLQQCNSYATRSPRTSTKGLKISRPEIQKSFESSPNLIEKQTEAQTTVWPRPSEIPFQGKVANFVNLIGYVKIPVQFESDSDGNYFAATVISLGGGNGRKPLLIPVVFEGDLAHIVACHVKESDSVFVSGKLSIEPLRFAFSESLGKFHVVAENLNFVEGFQKSSLDKIIDNGDSSDRITIDFSADNGENSDRISIDFPERTLEILDNGNVSVNKKKCAEEVWDLWRDLVNNPKQWWDYREHKANGLVKDKFPDFKQKESGEALWISSAPKWVFPGLGKLECDVKDLKSKQGQVGEFKNGGLEDSWKNLVDNPNKWWDNRGNKRNPKAPDFKHKETGEGLWLGGSPGWALSKLPPMKGDQSAAAYVNSFESF